MDKIVQDFRGRFLKAVYCEGKPDRVPFVETAVYKDIKERFLGSSITNLDSEIKFWSSAGYEAIPLETGLRLLIDAAINHGSVGRFREDNETSRVIQNAVDFARARLPKNNTTIMSGTGYKRAWAPEGKGFINSIADLEEFPWPQAKDLDYSVYLEIAEKIPENMGVLSFAGAIFSSVNLMMGMEEFLVQMTLETELFQKLLKKVARFQLEVIEILLEIGTVDGIWINDDMGFNTGVLVNPELLRKYIFPYYREIKNMTAKKGLPLLLHSDGNIYKILEDLIDIGFNAIHPIDPNSMSIEEVRNRIGNKLCLIGNLSLDYPLGIGTPEDVIKESKKLLELGSSQPGYCFAAGNSIPENIKYENWEAMRETVIKYG